MMKVSLPFSFYVMVLWRNRVTGSRCFAVKGLQRYQSDFVWIVHWFILFRIHHCRLVIDVYVQMYVMEYDVNVL